MHHLFHFRKLPTAAGLPAPFLEVQEYLMEAHGYANNLREKIAVRFFSQNKSFNQHLVYA